MPEVPQAVRAHALTVAEQLGHRACRNRLAEQKALTELTTQRNQFVGFALRLKPFGHDMHTQFVGQGDDGPQDDQSRGRSVLPHKGPVDLQRVEGIALQIGERGMAGAEIVQCQAGAQFADPPEHLRGKFRIAHDKGFGDLKLQRFRCDARTRQDRFDIVNQVVTKKLGAGDVDRNKRQMRLVNLVLPQRQVAAARSSAKTPSCTIKPLSSAAGMNSVGEMVPRFWCSQRNSAS